MHLGHMPDPRSGETKDEFIERCVPVVIEDGTAEDGDQAVAVCNSMWEEAMMTRNTFIANLQSGNLAAGKPFVGFAEGEFVDFRGREIEIEDESIPEYLANTLDLISQHKARGMPGLPIDEERHNMGKAAGWIVDAQETTITDSGGRIRKAIAFVAEWTKLGTELVTEKIMTNFSPQFNIVRKIIEGGTLTNWPASIDSQGVPLFNAIELSQGLSALSRMGQQVNQEAGEDSPAETSQGELTMSEEEKKTPAEGAPETTPEETPTKAPEKAAGPAAMQKHPNAEGPEDGLSPDEAAEIAEELFKKVPSFARSRPDDLAELVQQLSTQMAERQVQRLIEEQQQQWEITELAARLTGGGLRGLPVTIPELTDFFLSLDPAQFEAAKSIFGKITSHGLVEFQEIGHGRRLRKQQLPEEYHSHLRQAMDAGYTVEEFFKEVGLGDPAKYDLTRFKE